jgi:hypothetical protein
LFGSGDGHGTSDAALENKIKVAQNSVPLVAAATAAAAASAAGGAAGRSGGAAGACPGEDGELDRGFLAGALGAGDFLLLVDDDFFKLGFAVFADVFIDRHLVWSPDVRNPF